MKNYISDGLLLIVTIIWGVSFPLIRNAIEYIPDSTYIFLRFLVATITLLPILFIKRRRINTRVLLYGLLLGIILFGMMYFTVNALYYTSAINVAFLTGLSVVIVPFLYTICTRIIPKRGQLISAGISALGIFLLSGGINFNFRFGDLLGLFIAICSALQIILTNYFSRNQDALLLGSFQIIFCMIFSSIYWYTKKCPIVSFNSNIIIALVITGVFSTAIAFTIQTVAQRYTTAIRTAIIFSAEPVFGAIFSIIISKNNGSHEALCTSQAIGCTLIFISMIITEEDVLKILKHKLSLFQRIIRIYLH